MFYRSIAWLARRKHGQRAWNPNASPQGAAPATGITAAEALQIAYRPMPLANTVEYEEDFGANLIIHREFISSRNRDAMDFQLSGLAYSDTELSKGRAHFARMMNRERAGAVVGSGGIPDDSVHFHVADEDTGAEPGGSGSRGTTARYLFDGPRLAYCERFREALQNIGKQYAIGLQESTQHDVPSENASKGPSCPPPELFSLMEACAILYGCETREAQETYLQMFLGMSTDQLHDDKEKAGTTRGSEICSSAQGMTPSQLLPSSHLPSIFEDLENAPLEKTEEKPVAAKGEEQEVVRVNHHSSSASPSTPSPVEEDKKRSRDAELQGQQVTPCVVPSKSNHEFSSDYHDEGVFGSYNISELVSKEHLQVRRRWRRIMDKLVREEYHLLTPYEYGDACILNHQLHTVKFLDLKVGDAIKEMITIMQEDNRHVSSSVHRDSPSVSSPYHTENRN